MAKKCGDLAAELDTLHVQRSLQVGFTYKVIVDFQKCHLLSKCLKKSES
jgi:hypothetical protein